jgi:hypothetical protein
MRYSILAFSLSFLISCANSGSIKPPYDTNTSIPSPLALLFRNGEHPATLTTNKEFTGMQKEIFKKYILAINTNKSLREEFDKILENPQQFSNSVNLGLTKNELNVLLSIFKSNETSSQKETLTITNDDNYIIFKGTGKLAVLDSLRINSKDTLAQFRGTELKYYAPDSSYLTNEFMPTDEQLEYIFPFDVANGILGLYQITPEYLLVVGRLNKSGKTYIYLDINDPLVLDSPIQPFYSIILDK